MPHPANEELLEVHRQWAATSWFPYRGKAPEDPRIHPLSTSHIDKPVSEKAARNINDSETSNLTNDHDSWSNAGQQPANNDWVSLDPCPELQRDAKRAGVSGPKTLQIFVPPTSVRQCCPRTPLEFQVHSSTQSPDVPDAGEENSISWQAEEARMPSTIENPQIPLKDLWPAQKRNAAFENDEARLLGRPARSHDAAAVPITLPTTRLMNRVQVKIPSGGPKPRNTLRTNSNAPRFYAHSTARDKPKGGGKSPLLLRASRGDNVTHGPPASGSDEAWAMPSLKRQKISHQASSPISGSSTDELLDQQDPEQTTFGPLPMTGTVNSSQSCNSQGSVTQSKKQGSFTGLTEHKKVERMMNSAAPNKKQKRREAKQNQQNGHGLLIPPEPSSLSRPLDISRGDEGETAHPGPNVTTRITSRGTAEPPNPAGNARGSQSLASRQASAARKISPYFNPSSPPSRPANGTRDQRQSPTDIGTRKPILPDRLDEKFITINGTRRSSDINVSSDIDELQLGTTVGSHPDVKAISSIGRRRSKSPSKNSSSTLIALSPSGEDTRLEPSNIKRSEFTSPKPKLENDTRFTGPPVREKKVRWAVDVAAVRLAGKLRSQNGMGLVYDERTKAYVLIANGEPTRIQVFPHKLLKIYWENPGRRVRFMSSKTGTEDNLVDLELRKEKDQVDLVNRLQNETSCRTSSFTSERMARMFEKTRLEYNRSAPSDHSDSLSPVKIQQGGDREPPSPPALDWVKNSEVVEAKNQQPKLSVVEQLCGRAGLEDPPSDNRPPAKSVTNARPREANVTEVLARLKPNHNEHLRRSTRTSSEFKRPSRSYFDDTVDEPAIERYSRTHDLGEPWRKPLTYPKFGKKKITVEFSDLERLDEGEFLNDNLLSFYLRFLEHTLEEQRPNLAKRVYFFNTFFYATLMNTHKGKKGFNYEGVQKWTRNVDLFTYDYIVVPINEATHWYLAIICNLPALDRNLSLGEGEAGSHVQSTLADKSKATVELQQPSSSPSRDLPGEDSINRVEEHDEPDENGARRSFAEMTLDVNPKSPSANNMAPCVDTKSGSGESVNEDEEMLDVPSRDVTFPLKPTENNSNADRPGEDCEEILKDTDQRPQTVAKNKKGKRKSGPPTITKTRPDKPVIITFDSLGLPRSATIRILKDYLREEAKAKRGGMEFEPGEIKGITATHIPQQDNYYDCGVFLLGYVAKFLEDDPKDFIAKIIKREYDETEDWPNLKPSLLRTNIRDQVLKLHQGQVAERCQERDAQKSGKGVDQQDAKGPSTPQRAKDQSSTVTQKQHPAKPQVARELPGAPSSAQPTIRQEALDNALSKSRRDLEKEIASLMQSGEDEQATAEALDRDKEEAQDQWTKPRSSEGDRAPPTEGKQSVPESIENEPSVILIESQSQQDIPAPKSCTSSHPAPDPVHESPNLPAEIQDSQPSQASQTFANIVNETFKKDARPAPKEEEPPQDIPIVLVEDPPAPKRKKACDESAALTDAQKTLKKHDADFSRAAQQGNSPSRGRKKARTAQRSDEVIQIDD